MKRILFAILMFCFQAAEAQQADVKKTIETFFEAFHQRDTARLKTVFAKEMVLHSVAEKKDNATLTTESAESLLDNIAAVPGNVIFEEKLLSWEIQTDGSMAHVWTPYEFYINGKLSHTGVNSFQLFKARDGWKITYCIDTRRKP